MEVLHITTDNFKEEVLASDVPVLVDFWATWCGPCRAFAPTLDRLAAQSNGEYKVCKLDVDENESIAEEYMVQSIPTVMIFKNGEVAYKHVGMLTERELLAELGK